MSEGSIKLHRSMDSVILKKHFRFLPAVGQMLLPHQLHLAGIHILQPRKLQHQNCLIQKIRILQHFCFLRQLLCGKLIV